MNLRFGSFVLVLSVLLVESVRAAEVATKQLSLGTRVIVHELLDSKQSYIGNLGDLEVEDDYAPTRLFVDYFFTGNFGVELSWDSIEAEAANSSGRNLDVDGSVILEGPILQVVARPKTEGKWTPYGGVGLAFFQGSFDEATWWQKGYATEADWISLGRPNATRGKLRKMEVDDAVGFVASAGIDYEFAPGWEAGFISRLTLVEADATFSEKRGGDYEKISDGSFPLDSVSLGLTIRHWFK